MSDVSGEPGQERKLERIENEIIVLDYTDLRNKHFYQCKLIYRGGRPPNLINCVFDTCEFIFEGPALATLLFLGGIARSSGGKELVSKMLGIA